MLIENIILMKTMFYPEFDSLIFMLKDFFHIRWNDK